MWSLFCSYLWRHRFGCYYASLLSGMCAWDSQTCHCHWSSVWFWRSQDSFLRRHSKYQSSWACSHLSVCHLHLSHSSPFNLSFIKLDFWVNSPRSYSLTFFWINQFQLLSLCYSGFNKEICACLDRCSSVVILGYQGWIWRACHWKGKHLLAHLPSLANNLPQNSNLLTCYLLA